jgi:hypothetical protein
MGRSVCSYLFARVSAIAAGVIAIPPSVPAPIPVAAPVHQADVPLAARIQLAASVRSLVTTAPNPQHFAAAKAAIARIDPAASAAPAVQAATAPVPLDAASDWIVSSYQFLRYWVTYGVQLADYVLGFIPFGYLLADQVSIFYYNLGLPISDSIVYSLVVPVVNDPLNPASYVNGLIAVGQTSVNAAINTGIAEFNYFFGWLIPPLPPLPPAAARTAQPEEAVSTSSVGLDPTLTTIADAKDDQTSGQEEKRVAAAATDAPEVVTATPEPSATAEPSETPQPSDTPEPSKTPKSPKPPKTFADGVQAQGEVRDASTGTDTTTTTTTTTAADTDRAPVRAARDERPHEPSAPGKTATDKSTADKGADTN